MNFEIGEPSALPPRSHGNQTRYEPIYQAAEGLKDGQGLPVRFESVLGATRFTANPNLANKRGFKLQRIQETVWVYRLAKKEQSDG